MTDEQDPTAVRFPPTEENADHETGAPPAGGEQEPRTAGGEREPRNAGSAEAAGEAPRQASGEETAAAGEPGEAAEREQSAEEDLRERWQRALADLDNLRKRHARELERERAAERMRTAAALLPLVDHLEMALEHAGADPASVVEGVKAVRDEAVGTFEKLGFPRDDETGVPFDPLRHEAVGTVEDDGAEPGMVSEVLRPGYGGGATQLRPAAVTVTAPQE